MIVDRSEDFNKIREKYFPKLEIIIPECEALTTLTSSISKCEVLLKRLSTVQDKQYLPSFSKRKEINSEITQLKVEISLLFKVIGKTIKDSQFISPLKYNKQLYNTFSHHFNEQYQKILIDFRKIQEVHLKRVSHFAVFDELERKEESNIQCGEHKQELIEGSNKQEILKNSIYSLTTTLIELKSLISKQVYDIDRLDVHMDRISINIKKTNKEIIKIKNRQRNFKDKIIFSLLLFALILFFFVVLKVEHKKISDIFFNAKDHL